MKLTQDGPIDREKKCSRCGAAFTCSTNDCWCSALPAIEIMGVADCMCPACLNAVLASQMQHSNLIGATAS